MKRIRAIYDCWPEFRARLPEVWLALRDTGVPAWSRLQSALHAAARPVHDIPEWLSSRTESHRDIRYRRQKGERISIGESFHRRLHGFHSIKKSSALAAGVFAFAVSVSVIADAAYETADVPKGIGALPGTLMTVAEVLGGGAGILFAVIVFGIQFHGEKLDKAAFLVRYLRRREGLIPIAAFTLAVVAANVVVALLCSLGMPHAALPMAVMDIPFVIIILWLVLWLIHRMAVSVSEDPAKLLMPSLTYEYDRALDGDIHHASQVAEFDRALASTAIRYSTVAGLTDLDRVPPTKLKLLGSGSVKDINLTALRTLDTYMKAACPNHEATLTIGPGDSVNGDVALVLSVRRDDQGGQLQEAVAPDKQVIRELKRHLKAVYRLGAVEKHDVVEVLDRFQTMLVGIARSASEEELDRWLEVQGKLMERGLKRGDANRSSYSIRRERLPDIFGGFHHAEMAENAVASGDQKKISVLLTFACRVMATAVCQDQQGLFAAAGRIVEAVYRRAILRKDLADYVGGRIDDILYSLSAQFAYLRSWRLDTAKIVAQVPVQVCDRAWRLELIKLAIETGRTEDASRFQDRLILDNRDVSSDTPPELAEAYDLVDFATIITAAWCLYLVETGHKHADTAKAVFHGCATDLGTREELLCVWEAVRSKSYIRQTSVEPFGVSRWTMDSPSRAGEIVSGAVSDAWIERGFMALMLARPSAPKYELPDAMRTCPPFRHKSPDEVKTLADSILDNDAVRKDLLNITDDKRDETINAVVALFGERLRLFKIDRLDSVVAAPLRDEHHVRLHKEIAKELENDYGLRSTLAKLGGLRAEARAWFLPRIRYEVLLQKDSAVDCCEHPMDFAPFIAKDIRKGQDIWITRAAEQMAKPTVTIQRLAELADAVRDAITRLRRTTNNPTLVFVPHERRIIEAINGRNGWRLPSRFELGDSHIGDWEGCHLLRFPYVEPSSVVIMDALAFYGRITEPAYARLEFDITNPQEASHDELLRQAHSESDPTNIPETDTITVLASARYSADTGLHDPNSVLRVDLDLTMLGYALVESEDVYHRPGCSLLPTLSGEVSYKLAPRLRSVDEARTPCEHCRPDDWEERAECVVSD